MEGERRRHVAVITISRAFGSEGLAVARRAAEVLGYSCLDRGLVTEVARMADVSEQEVARYDERGQGPVADLLERVFVGRSGGYPVYAWGGECAEMMVAPALFYSDLEQGRVLSREDIISLIEHVIRAAADRGNVVIVGRGAQVVLADRPDALHVRVIAPIPFRCGRIVEREGVDPEEAMELIRRTDRDRARYLRQYYRVDWEDGNLYHLTINTERTGVDLAARLIAGAASRGVWARQERHEETAILQYTSPELLEAEG